MKKQQPKWLYTCQECGKNVPAIRYDRETAKAMCDECYEDIVKNR